MEDLYVKLKSLKIILKEFFLGNYFWFSAGSVTMPSREPLEMCEEDVCVYHKNWKIFLVFYGGAKDVEYLACKIWTIQILVKHLLKNTEVFSD